MEGKPIELDLQSMERVLGPPTDVSSLGKRGTSISQLAFNLYREATGLLLLVANLSGADDLSLARNHAIEAGLAVRITKFMTSVLALEVDKVRNHGEVTSVYISSVVRSEANTMLRRARR